MDITIDYLDVEKYTRKLPFLLNDDGDEDLPYICLNLDSGIVWVDAYGSANAREPRAIELGGNTLMFPISHMFTAGQINAILRDNSQRLQAIESGANKNWDGNNWVYEFDANSKLATAELNTEREIIIYPVSVNEHFSAGEFAAAMSAGGINTKSTRDELQNWINEIAKSVWDDSDIQLTSFDIDSIGNYFDAWPV